MREPEHLDRFGSGTDGALKEEHEEIEEGECEGGGEKVVEEENKRLMPPWTAVQCSTGRCYNESGDKHTADEGEHTMGYDVRAYNGTHYGVR